MGAVVERPLRPSRFSRMQLPAPTERIAFRAWHDDDMPRAMQLWGDPQVAELVGGPFGERAVRERLATELANQRDHAIAYWPIAVGGVDAGCCGLKPRVAGTYELGFYLRVPYWGQGLAVEAGRSVIAHAFGVLGA